MIKYRNILVVIDPSLDDQAALARAIYLAKREGKATIKALLTIYDFSYEMSSMLSGEEREAMRSGVIEERTKWLEELLKPYLDPAVKIEAKVLWHNRSYEAIIGEVLDFGHDLIVKSTQHHPKLQSVIFTPTDWHLLRKSPCPVLMVKEREWLAKGTIVAAIHAGAEDDMHLQLNRRITEDSLDLCQLLDSSLHLVAAYPAAPVNIAIELPDFDPQIYNTSVREHHEKMLTAHAANYNIAPSFLHVEEGLPDDTIPEIARKLDADLVVLGTCGRSGLSAALIGNTAEHVIDQLDCDLLALKPVDFVSPVKGTH
jgi:universal stress protein E